MAGRARARLVAVLLATAFAARAEAQVPAGGEFRVNTFTTTFAIGLPASPAAAADAGGNFVITWDSYRQDGSGYGVFARRFDAAGTPRGAEFRVNTYTTGTQQGAVPSCDARGNFVVAWPGLAESGYTVNAQRFDAAGQRRGAEMRVSTSHLVWLASTAAATDARGNIVIAWSGQGVDDVLARRYDPAGAPLGGEFRVNAYTTGLQVRPAAAFNAAGGFVIAWHGPGYWLVGDVFGRRFDVTGAPLGDDMRVNTFTTGGQSWQSLAADAVGNFVVVWQSYPQDGDSEGVFGQRFDAAGSRLGVEFRVNTYTTGHQHMPAVASDANGNFVVVWSGDGPAADQGEIFGRRYDATGTARGAEFKVNTATAGWQFLPAIASDPSGNFVVTWRTYGGAQNVFAQRFGGLVPVAVRAVEPMGNGVLEPGETAVLETSWRNVNGAPQTFGGRGTRFTGPPASGVAYLLHDASADYGTLPNGATGTCTDCYQVEIAFGGTRPATHWDATLQESILPDALGQQTAWRVHIGESFVDVPRASPYYRFVETLLHQGVSAGCGPAQYCPTSSTTREQMAVFGLTAREGAVYLPPACGPIPRFGDVPASSPFCRWIEELARRGVTGGCGGGNFCPAATVSREQMAVFVLRTLDPSLDPPACAPPNLYGDVPESSPFCRWIEELTRRGVVGGCGGGNYCPAASVTREQMAVFVSVTFGLTLYGP